ncbi:MAG: aminotransferase class V-fold PLP-dependent enzyme [Lachnospiraceae bacterium]|nr:aminotransferase class V-fold PLP-dependent enzyme [Lachnospiraceae bacterium]
MKNNNTSSVGRFIEEYRSSETLRLHMPGHKGAFGYEDDITEIKGADSLYAANGIIRDAEAAVSKLFGSRRTFFGTEGSSQLIKGMCFLALNHYRLKGGTAEHPVILAARNAHKAFICASMLLGFRIRWMAPENDFSLCRCKITSEDLKKAITECDKADVAAVYVTSPDYLGNLLDIKDLAQTAHEEGLLFLCDNAHGSYLRFAEPSLHPLSLGADMTSDSAHKTLPVLTGGAFLHISENAPKGLEDDARNALLMFGSTSPSYLILRSLSEVPERVKKEDYVRTSKDLAKLRKELESLGYLFYGNEPLKLVFDLRHSALSGEEFGDAMRTHRIECEYSDPDFLVTMWTPFNNFPEDCEKLFKAAKALLPEYKKSSVQKPELSTHLPKVKHQPYEVLYRPHFTMKVTDPALPGHVAADALISCPPAVSPVVAGEIIDENAIKILKYYGFETVEVLR